MNEEFVSSVQRELPFILFFLLFVGVRVGYLLTGGSAIDSDEAIIGLMGQHVLAGEHVTFFYGQEYMGSLEAYIAALMFSLFGVSSWVLKVVLFLFAVVFFHLSVHLARSLYGRQVGLLTAFLLVFSSPFFLVWSLKARGGYMETLVFGTILLLLARKLLFHASPWRSVASRGNTRYARSVFNWLLVLISALLFLQLERGGVTLQFGDVTVSSRGFTRPLVAFCICWLAGHVVCKEDPIRLSSLLIPYWRNMAFFGFVAGLSWWTNQLILFYLVPIGCVLIWCLRSTLRTGANQLYFAATFVVSFFLGSSPYWTYRFLNGFVSSGVTGIADRGDWLQQGGRFFSIAIPRLFGCWFNFTGDPLTAGCSVLVLTVYALSLLFLAQRLFLQLSSDGVAGIKKVEVIFFLFLCCYPLLFSISSMGWFTSEPRYLLPLFSVLPIVAARFLSQIRARSTGSFVFLLTPFFVLSLLNAASFESSAMQPRVKNMRLPVSFTPLRYWLGENQIKYVYTDYWVAYRLIFESKEEIICSVYPPFVNDRYPLYSELVGKVDKPAYIIMQTVSSGFEVMLDEMGISHYRRKELSPFVVYYDMEIENRDENTRRLLLTRQNLVSLPSEQYAELAIDGHLNTRWQSQKRGSEKYSSFQIDLGRIASLRHLDLIVGNFLNEVPKSLHVEISEQGERWEQIRVYSDPAGALGVYEVCHPLGYWLVRLRINIDGRKTRFVRLSSPIEEGRWSIAEIEIFEVMPNSSSYARAGKR